jgi:hypothetical protein
MITIRLHTPLGRFVLRDPRVVESSMFGLSLEAIYRREDEERFGPAGLFPLRQATRAELVQVDLSIEAGIRLEDAEANFEMASRFYENLETLGYQPDELAVAWLESARRELTDARAVREEVTR